MVPKGDQIKRLVIEGRYELSRHPEREREADKISVKELEEALVKCEVIEDYPDDPRGASCFALGFSGEKPIHTVCSIRTEPDELLLITIYDPSKHPHEWIDNYRKRKG